MGNKPPPTVYSLEERMQKAEKDIKELNKKLTTHIENLRIQNEEEEEDSRGEAVFNDKY